MDRLLPGFMDEMEKIAISLRLSSFKQTRKGRRPIRVHNLMKKETAFLPHRSPLRNKGEVKIDDVLDPQERNRKINPAGVASRGEAEVESGRGLQESGMY
jgi:hypothetical protein